MKNYVDKSCVKLILRPALTERLEVFEVCVRKTGKLLDPL